MSNLLYLLLAVGLSVFGSLALWFRHRRPRKVEYGVDAFQRELRALAPERRESE